MILAIISSGIFKNWRIFKSKKIKFKNYPGVQRHLDLLQSFSHRCTKCTRLMLIFADYICSTAFLRFSCPGSLKHLQILSAGRWPEGWTLSDRLFPPTSSDCFRRNSLRPRYAAAPLIPSSECNSSCGPSTSGLNWKISLQQVGILEVFPLSVYEVDSFWPYWILDLKEA